MEKGRKSDNKLTESQDDFATLERVVTSISSRLLKVDSFLLNEAINNSLADCGSLAGVDRAYLIIFSDDRTSFTMTHEWHRSGVKSASSFYRRHPLTEHIWFYNILASGQSIVWNNLDQIPDCGSQLKTLLKAREVTAIAMMPLIYQGSLIGTLGFSTLDQERTWNPHHISLLKIVSEILVNVIQRHNSENARLSSERKYRDLVETSSDLIWSVDTEGRWSFVNQAVKKIYGYEPSEVLGRPFTEFLGKELAERDFKVFESVLSGEAVTQYETTHIRKDGAPICLSFNAIALRDSNGKVIGTTGTAQDITARKAAESELIRQKTFLREVIDSSPNLVFAKDRNGRYTLANRAMSELHNRPVDLIIGMRDTDLLKGAESVKALKEADNAIFVTGESQFLQEVKMVHKKTGEARYFQTIKRPLIGESGTIEQVLGVAWDITDRKRAEENSVILERQLLQSQKMEAIGQLAAGIAHDLNNALAAVVGHLQLIRSSQDLPATSINSTDIALQGCQRASTLIEQLLGFSRQGKYNMQVLSLQQTTRETIDFLRKVVGTNIKIILEGSPEELNATADSAQIQQVLTNLIINAKQAMPYGGTITFKFGRKYRARPERFNSLAIPGSYSFISVCDSGIGISPENLDKIFEPFFTTKSNSNSGTGLGLSTVYGVMQNHGGWVEVESAEGRGSIFTLYFPEPRSSLDSQKENEKLPHQKTRSTVLVIDDERVLVDLAQQFLQRAGYRTFGFQSSTEALKWYQQNWQQVDLIILDMKMPEMDGNECFEKIQISNPNASVVILSGYSNDHTAQEMLKRGVLKFFQKPLRYSELVQWISENIAQSKAA